MTEVTGNLWEYKASYRVITTNGFVKKNGEAVMGRGVAKQAATHYPHLPRELGERILKYGNVLQFLPAYRLFCFPVKHNWYERADIALIRKSALQLNGYAKTNPGHIYVMPRPGCGNGGLTWEEVKPAIEFLVDNIHVICL